MSEAAAAGAAAEHCFADDDDRARYHVWMGEPRIRPATPTQDTAAERAVASGGQVAPREMRAASASLPTTHHLSSPRTLRCQLR